MGVYGGSGRAAHRSRAFGGLAGAACTAGRADEHECLERGDGRPPGHASLAQGKQVGIGQRTSVWGAACRKDRAIGHCALPAWEDAERSAGRRGTDHKGQITPAQRERHHGPVWLLLLATLDQRRAERGIPARMPHCSVVNGGDGHLRLIQGRSFAAWMVTTEASPASAVCVSGSRRAT